MNYEQAIEYIETKTWSTTRLGLERTQELLRKVGDPQKKLKFIHVAGSNGKGSTCAMLASILCNAGYRTGLYTSPHIQSFCERFQINGKYIEKEQLAEITEQVRDAAEQMEDHPSQFEISTAIGMLYFKKEQCDVVVLEVGMGGLLDSTNAIDSPEIAVIMNIGLEHTEYLGDTIEEIAETKAGIIKDGTTVVCYPSGKKAECVIARVCEKKNAALHMADFEDVEKISGDIGGTTFRWKRKECLHTPLLGEHQLKNCAVVLKVIEVLRNQGWTVDDDAVRKGLAKTVWPARMEVLSKTPLFLLDGGHNPQCTQALMTSLHQLFPGEKILFMLGVLGDKDYTQMLEMIGSTAQRIICVTPDSPRALPAEQLENAVSETIGCPAETAESIADGIGRALNYASEITVAFGSLYMAGEIRDRFPIVRKKLERERGIRGRESLGPEERCRRNKELVGNILNTEEYQKAKTIFSYRAVRAEVDLSELDRRAIKDGKIVLYPLCTSKTAMEARRPKTEADYRKGAFGIPEPDPEKSEYYAPDQIDLVLCPCTSFDEQGTRIGMGGGYYDRYLPGCVNAKVLAVAYEEQKSEVPLEKEEYDYILDAAVTDKRIYRFKK